MQFQKGQRGKGAGAGRAIVQAGVQAGLEERGRGDRDCTPPRETADFPVFSLFASVIFGRIRSFTRLFAVFPIRPPPFEGIYRGTETGGCTATCGSV